MDYESPAGGVDLSSYVDPDPSTGTDGSIVRAPAIENHQRELRNLIVQAGLTPSRGDLTQIHQAVLALIAAQSRKRYLVAPTFYCSPSGNDSNAGTIGAPFLTIQRAVDEQAKGDYGQVGATIQLADGTYTAPVAIARTLGTLTITGNLVTPANVLVSTSGAHAISCSGRADVILQGFEIRTTGGPYIGLIALGYATVNVFPTMRFGACQQYQMQCSSHATLAANGYTISGGALAHWYSADHGLIQAGGTITLTGTPAYSVAFAQAQNMGEISMSSGSFSGAATGARYRSAGLSLIYTNGLTLPGNAGGSVADGGVFL